MLLGRFPCSVSADSSARILALGCDSNQNIGIILNRIVNPFGDLIQMDLHAVEEWISTLPNISNVDIFSEYILSQIELDYIENRVVLVEGIVLSETEVKLYRAREIYA